MANPLTYALAATQLANTLIRIAERVDTGDLTPEEAEAAAIKEWNDTAARVQAADDRWQKIDQAARG